MIRLMKIDVCNHPSNPRNPCFEAYKLVLMTRQKSYIITPYLKNDLFFYQICIISLRSKLRKQKGTSAVVGMCLKVCLGVLVACLFEQFALTVCQGGGDGDVDGEDEVAGGAVGACQAFAFQTKFGARLCARLDF